MFVEETVEWTIPCTKCKKKKDHTKTMKLASLPKYLVICFQRYGKYGKKNTSSIQFSEELNVDDYLDLELLKNEKNKKYNLIGVSNHSGSMEFGHYYA